MRKNIKWEAYTNKNRHEMINKIQTMIMDHDGFIINFNRFSDMVLTLNIEIEENKIPGLYKDLSTISSLASNNSKNLHANITDSRKECSLFLNITFKSGSGNLEIETDKYAM